MQNVELLLLRTGFRHLIDEPTVEAGFDRFLALTGSHIQYDAFCSAVAACLGAGLIREPVRLSQGALQCRWHLELTAAGVASARLLSNNQSG